MNKITHYIKTLCAIVALVPAVTACSDWTETEVSNPVDLTVTNRDAKYYENLREYKKSDHPVAFGWFGNWTGNGAKMENCLMGLPDSVDFVSLWGNFKNINDNQKEDLRKVQTIKGTKVLICFLVFDIGDQITPELPKEESDKGTSWTEWRRKFWGWGDDESSQLAATEKYANAICDTIDKYNYDGFDLDAERDYAQPFETQRELWLNPKVMEVFLKTLSKRIGPKSGTGRMLVVDGQPETMPLELFDHFDYFILQAYNSTNFTGLNNRANYQYNYYKDKMSAEELCKRLIVCENFENYAREGGVNFTLPDGTKMKSLAGMAYWNPTINGKVYRKGGVGTYHMEYEYDAKGSVNTYPFLRQAINIMNPIIK